MGAACAGKDGHVGVPDGIGTPRTQPQTVSKLASLMEVSESCVCLHWLIWGSSRGRGFRFSLVRRGRVLRDQREEAHAAGGRARQACYCCCYDYY